MTNVELFEYSNKNPEKLFDEYYSKNCVIITDNINENNDLMEKNNKLLELISAYDVLRDNGIVFQEEAMNKVVDAIDNIMYNTPSINYSAFSQFFMVYNQTYSIYKSLDVENRKKFLYEMLEKYCLERHKMYLSHGYTSAILQVMCDNYSHKRNSKSGINKVLEILKPLKLDRLGNNHVFCKTDNYYFLPDKGDSELFESMLIDLGIDMESRDIEHNKLPDIVFKYNENYYICELKTMKGAGGGQDKQIVEVANFIKYQEKMANVHYLVFLDGEYYNELIKKETPKIKIQFDTIIENLNNNNQNYFLNTAGLVKFVENIK